MFAGNRTLLLRNILCRKLVLVPKREEEDIKLKYQVNGVTGLAIHLCSPIGALLRSQQNHIYIVHEYPYTITSPNY